ncbi:uncharacterized protein Dwil_GK28274 [Drosophila willistoni]|uniref:Uncharacterized protein n=1 Tax=Drosophila willistoni TaxID=7260 RepID=A0A0Q9WTQ6_DROWI|nr:uncharacterized protein Dwil_GK28274 [Drosophila willistoni]
MEKKNINKLRLNGCQMYPRARVTEFYTTPQPRPSIQSRCAEHPKELNRTDGPEQHVRTAPPVIPSPNPNNQEYRNSYFS